MRSVTFLVCLLLLLLPMPLREADLDYLVAVGFCGAVAVACLLSWRLPLSRFDVGWLLALGFAIPQIAFALAADARPTDVAFQALIFIMPIVALAVRLSPWGPSDQLMGKIALWLCALKFVAYLPYSEEFILALTTAGERYRFHDLSGIVVCLFLVGCLTAGLFKSLSSRAIIGITTVLLLAAAAHRSLYLAVLVQIAFALYISGTSRQRLNAMVFSAGVLAVTYATPFGQVIMELFASSLSGDDGNTNARISLSQAVWNGAFELPLGHGFGGYFMYGVDSDSDLVTYALHHNSYLTYLYYLGWVPFVAAIVSVVATIAYVPAETKSAVAIKSAFIGMTVFACFNMFLESPVYAVFYWLVFGALTARLQPSLARRGEKQGQLALTDERAAA